VSQFIPFTKIYLNYIPSKIGAWPSPYPLSYTALRSSGEEHHTPCERCPLVDYENSRQAQLHFTPRFIGSHNYGIINDEIADKRICTTRPV